MRLRRRKAVEPAEAFDRVMVTEPVRQGLIERARLALPNETGGIMLGFMTQDGPLVTDLLEIVAVVSKRASFKIPKGLTQEIVRARKAGGEQIGYLGDWHSHPAPMGPSLVDFKTLAALSGKGTNPRLIGLVRVDGDGWIVQMWRWDSRLGPSECQIELTGPVGHVGDHRDVTARLPSGELR